MPLAHKYDGACSTDVEMHEDLNLAPLIASRLPGQVLYQRILKMISSFTLHLLEGGGEGLGPRS